MKNEGPRFFRLASPGFGVAILGLYLLQQAVAASGSWWLVEFTKAVPADGNWRWPLAGFLIAMVFPYAPGFLALYLTQRWIPRAQQAFWENALGAVAGRVDLLGSTSARDAYRGLVKEISLFIEEALRFLGNLCANALNFVFNVGVVLFILERDFFFSFLLSFAITAVCFFALARVNRREGGRRQETLHGVDRVMLGSWYDGILRNPYSHALFQSSFEARGAEYAAQARRTSIWENAGGFAMAMASFAPILFMIVSYAGANAGDPVKLLVLGVLLPRVFAIWNVLVNTLSLAQQSTGFHGRWENMRARWSATFADGALDGRIRRENIRLEIGAGDEVKLGAAVDAVLAGSAPAPTTGRITLRGPNGAGKTSLLLALKRGWGERAFYLPAVPELSLRTLEGVQGSTGQKVRRALEEVVASLPTGVALLIDEWDANLDHEATTAMEQALRAAAGSRLIIDIRHH